MMTRLVCSIVVLPLMLGGCGPDENDRMSRYRAGQEHMRTKSNEAKALMRDSNAMMREKFQNANRSNP
ncbi:MAG: hypothetical protein MK077_07675 [Phycisphaerales bacterium]|nr:hypothetical protein [Phycisphaerales bacterium]